MFPHREYNTLKEERLADRQAYRAEHHRRNSGRAISYPEHLALMDSFSDWLRVHVRELRAADFPLEEKLIQLSTTPSTVAESYAYMWAYGALFRCVDDESVRAYATYDSGICTSVCESRVNSVDVGVLKGLYRVSFSGWDIVVMKVEWVGQESIRKDRMGFWTCKLDARGGRSRINPYILPVNAEQVFFMEDVLTPDWKIVLRHEPRARRIVGDSSSAFGHSQSDTAFENIGGASTEDSDMTGTGDVGEQPRQVPLGRVQELDVHMRREEADSHYDDNEYEDDDDFEHLGL